MGWTKIGLLLLLLVAAAIFFAAGGLEALSFESVKSGQKALQNWMQEEPLLGTLLFVGGYILLTALSLPGAAILTLLAGGLFGFWWGLIAVSFASTLGATLAMLFSRFLFRASIAKRFDSWVAVIDEGVTKDGARYLFSLRLVPAIPFFVINLVMGLTRMPATTFFWVSQLGMLPGTAIYVNAGVQLSDLSSPAGILSPALLASLLLLALLPWLMKALLNGLEARRQYRGYPKPKRFDRDLVVIGAGSGGLVTALIGATVKAEVTLIESNEMGGDCLNSGCVPSKALITSARLASEIDRSERLGISVDGKKVDFAKVMAGVDAAIETIRPNDSPERYRDLGVDVRLGHGRVKTPYEVEVNGEVLTTRSIVLATGAAPIIPDIDGLDSARCFSSETIWSLSELPPRLAVVGGGPIGVELAQSFSRLGSKVTLIEMMPRIMIREDGDVAEVMSEVMTSEGVELHLGHRLISAVTDTAVTLTIAPVEMAADSEPHKTVVCDAVLFAAGRRPRVTGFGLEDLGIKLTERGQIAVDPYLRTNFTNIYAVGDVAGRYQLTHTASHMAWYAAVNALFGTFRRFKIDERVIPWCTFSSPEVARVGLNEAEAKEQGIAVEVTRFDIAELDRAIAERERRGFVKVLTKPGSDKILGVTIVSAHAGETIAEFVLAMKHGLGLRKILATIHIYPTWSEMNKFTAGAWQKARKPEWLMPWLTRYHRFRRGD